MSLHSTLVASTAWPADLVTAGVVATAGQGVSGRRAADKVDSRGAIWLERLPASVSGDVQQVRAHPYRVHYLYRLNGGPDKAGTAQKTHVEAKMRAIADRYHGQNLSITGVSNVVSTSALEDTVDVDPGDDMVLDGTVTVTFFVKESNILKNSLKKIPDFLREKSSIPVAGLQQPLECWIRLLMIT